MTVIISKPAVNLREELADLRNDEGIKGLQILASDTSADVVSLLDLDQHTFDINGGTIDGTVIGGTTPAAISGTTGQFGTSLNVDGTIKLDGNYPVGANNVALGLYSLDDAGLTGADNTAIGTVALTNNTSGTSNTGLGKGSLISNTTGSYNTGVGKDSLNSNTTASYNTAVGYQAGYSNTTGAASTYLGWYSGQSTTGAENTFVGTSSGYLVSTGGKNTILGRYSGNQGGLDIRTSSNNIVLSDGDGNPRVRVDASGYAYIPNMPVGGTANMHWSVTAGQLFVTSSSRRFKHGIIDYDKGLNEVLQMQPKYFVYNDEPNQKQRAGFIAEDFHDLGMTEFVEYWKDDADQDTPSEIGYSNMVALLVKAIQDQQQIITALEARITALETK